MDKTSKCRAGCTISAYSGIHTALANTLANTLAEEQMLRHALAASGWHWLEKQIIPPNHPSALLS